MIVPAEQRCTELSQRSPRSTRLSFGHGGPNETTRQSFSKPEKSRINPTSSTSPVAQEGLRRGRAGHVRGDPRHVRGPPQRVRVRHQRVGAKSEAQIANEGRDVNTSWDAVWTVATRRDVGGWSAEIRIPFKTLRFERGADRIWGVNFSRRIRRKNEIDYWSPVPRVYNLYRAGHAFVTNLVTSRIGYAFSTRTFLDTLLQYNADLKQLSANVRFDLIHVR